MSDFMNLKVAIQKHFSEMESSHLLVMDTDKDKLWETYLKSFPEGSNPIYKERTEHDCNCCRNFIKNYGGIVTLKDDKLISIWDINVGGEYQVVADALSKLVKKSTVSNIFLNDSVHAGTDSNRQLLEDGTVRKWDHFYVKLPNKVVKPADKIGTMLGDSRSNKEVLQRSLEELTLESAEAVLELIDQNSLYRGQEHKAVVSLFVKMKKQYDKLKTAKDKSNFCWIASIDLGGASKIRNTVIGTLLSDLSEGKELDVAVKAFETKVAPANYKRTTALITKGMIDQAQKKVAELGIEASLTRRHAFVDDITINNVLFANRAAKKSMNVFNDLTKEVKATPKKFDKVEEISIDAFVKDVLPKVESIEILFENKHVNNLVNVIAPVDKDAVPIFKWDNNFSWSYNGEVTDSIKERVKNAGGNVDGILRCSLSWFNYDDLDIHVIEPNRNEICFYQKNSNTSGKLDVDMNAGGGKSRTPVENIVWTDLSKMKEGLYKVIIHNYNKRENIDVGFTVEIEYEGKMYHFNYDKALRGSTSIEIVTFNFSKKDGIVFPSSVNHTELTRSVWGLDTTKFHTVKMMMNSPNFWDDQTIGNKHHFFILEDCKNDTTARGFYNEFLKQELVPHRKVFEVLGSKMKVPESDNQLAGLGFSSTQRNQVICKVTGSFTRMLKINF